MRFVVPNDKKELITHKSDEGIFTYSFEDKEYECVVVSMSTNGTYILETIEENNNVKRNI
jgi:hypothetical protein